MLLSTIYISTLKRNVQLRDHTNHDCIHDIPTLTTTTTRLLPHQVQQTFDDACNSGSRVAYAVPAAPHIVSNQPTFTYPKKTPKWAKRPLRSGDALKATAVTPMPTPSGPQASTSFRNNSGQKGRDSDANHCNHPTGHGDPIGRTGTLKFSHAVWKEYEVDPYAILAPVDRKVRRAQHRSGKSSSYGYPARSLGKSLVAARELADRLNVPKRSRTMETNRRWPIHWTHEGELK